MNIVEAYIKFKGQMIILISGLSGSGKSKLQMNIARDFKLKKMNLEDFCLDDSKIKNDPKFTVTLSNNVKVINWDDIDTHDWDSFNKNINNNKKDGVVVIGSSFPTEKLNFEADFHLNVKISKQKLIDVRREYIKKHPEKCEDMIKILNTPTEFILVNQIVYPQYLNNIEKSKVSKYLNANILNDDQIYDGATDYLFAMIQRFLDSYTRQHSSSSFSSSSSPTSDTTSSSSDLTSSPSTSNDTNDKNNTNDTDWSSDEKTNETTSSDISEDSEDSETEKLPYVGSTKNIKELIEEPNVFTELPK